MWVTPEVTMINFALWFILSKTLDSPCRKLFLLPDEIGSVLDHYCIEACIW